MDPDGAAKWDVWAAWPSASYTDVAHEYYDVEFHPTSAALGFASSILLRRFAMERSKAGQLLEVGAGHASLYDLKDVLTWRYAIVSDVCSSMLSHVRRLPATGSAGLVMLDAQRLGLRTSSIDTILASLADPYNSGHFWNEAARCLRPDGAVMSTFPSYEWASQWRRKSGEPPHQAVFELRNAEQVAVPSTVLPLQEQLCMIERAGLRVKLVDHVKLQEVQTATEKLTSVLLPDGPMVTGILAVRP